jgi:hypothetical protein
MKTNPMKFGLGVDRVNCGGMKTALRMEIQQNSFAICATDLAFYFKVLSC